MKIMIDPGHGGRKPGAVNERLAMKESVLVLAYARALRDVLVKGGHRVKSTREEDVDIELSTRCMVANAWKPDLFLSIHANAASEPMAHGIEVWTSRGQTRADAFATAIYNAIESEFPERVYRKDMTDGDVDKEGDLAVVVGTKCPAVLLEIGFISNDMEAEWLDDDETLFRYVRAIARGIEACGAIA